MSQKKKKRICAIAHLAFALLAILYFIIILSLGGSGGSLNPDRLLDDTSDAVRYAIVYVLFLVFFSIGLGVGVIEAILQGVLLLIKRPAPSSDTRIFLYASLFIKASVIADCLFLAVLMGYTLFPLAPGAALAYVLPTSAFALCEGVLFALDLLASNGVKSSDDTTIDFSPIGGSQSDAAASTHLK